MDDARFNKVPVALWAKQSETVETKSSSSHSLPALSSNDILTDVPLRSEQMSFLKWPKARTRRSSSLMVNFEEEIRFFTKLVNDKTGLDSTARSVSCFLFVDATSSMPTIGMLGNLSSV